MNEVMQRLMTEATQLTRSGNLDAATHAIQRALRGASSEAFGVSEPAAPPPTQPQVHRPPSKLRWVLDGLTRFAKTPLRSGANAPLPEVRVEDEALRETEDKVHYVEPPQEPYARGTQPERWIDGSFTHQGRTLAYKLFVPHVSADAVARPRPLVLMLHGCTQGSADFAAGTQMNELARKQGVVVLYPDQTQHANAQKCWNWFKPQHQQRGRGEPAVLAALTQAVTAEYGVDAKRVYVAGLSAGGAMADIMGRCYPEIFAAVGVHSGLPSGAASDVVSALSVMRTGAGPGSSGQVSPVPPTIVFHGDADSTVNVSNGAAIVEAASRAGAESAGASPAATQGHSAKGLRYTRTVYAGEAGRSQVEYWKLHGAGHAWSGGSPQGSYTNPAGPDASAEMLRFFAQHRGA